DVHAVGGAGEGGVCERAGCVGVASELVCVSCGECAGARGGGADRAGDFAKGSACCAAAGQRTRGVRFICSECRRVCVCAASGADGGGGVGGGVEGCGSGILFVACDLVVFFGGEARRTTSRCAGSLGTKAQREDRFYSCDDRADPGDACQ